MKRLFTLIVSLILTFSLIACTAKPVKDFNATIVKETLSGQTIVVHAVIDENTSEDNALKFIGNEIAVEVFNKHKNTIGLDQMTLTIYLFDSEADNTQISEAIASIVFNINNTVTQPGLSQGTFQKN